LTLCVVNQRISAQAPQALHSAKATKTSKSAEEATHADFRHAIPVVTHLFAPRVVPCIHGFDDAPHESRDLRFGQSRLCLGLRRIDFAITLAKAHHRRLLLRRRLEVPASEVLEVAFTRKKPASATAPTMTRIPGVVEKNDAGDAGPATLGPAVIGTSDFNVE
jgi:hypothetical protein